LLGEQLGPMCVLAAFDAVYSFFAQKNRKSTWMCKSMGLSKYHDLLLKYYGRDRLRYLYLVRDPRDVAMSFMKTPVGDCHYYVIAEKWCALQDAAARVCEECRDLVLTVTYEDLLRSRDMVTAKVHAFLGSMKFSAVDSDKSVLAERGAEELNASAKASREATTASPLSYQFKNLVRGDSFAKEQFQKWKNGKEPLPEADLLLIESVAHKTMKRLGYEPHLVGVSREPMVFSPAEVAEFENQNKDNIEVMKENLRKDDPDDLQRRQYQAEVLSLPAERLPSLVVEGERPAGYEPEELRRRLVTEGRKECLELPGGLRLRVGAVTLQGYHPTHQLPNQDTLCLAFQLDSQPHRHLIGVLDGHGPDGEKCSRRAAEVVPLQLAQSLAEGKPATEALHAAHIRAAETLWNDASLHTLSGTTAVSALFDGSQCWISHVGDSRCILGSERKGRLEAKVLTSDHDPSRADELKRVKDCGARVLTKNELHGEEQEGAEGVPRVWAKDKQRPGCAFTRSLGDKEAQSVGIVADPEVQALSLSAEDRVLVLASDGVTDVLGSEFCCERAVAAGDPLEAAAELVQLSVGKWMEKSDRVDDISIAVCLLEHKGGARSGAAVGFYLLAAAMAVTSGFLGGFCGIPGPPIILFFLHFPVAKKVQKANGTAITGLNAATRVVVYLVDLFFDDGSKHALSTEDVWLYVCVALCALLGAGVGGVLFQRIGNDQVVIKVVLVVLLFLNGVTMTVSALLSS